MYVRGAAERHGGSVRNMESSHPSQTRAHSSQISLGRGCPAPIITIDSIRSTHSIEKKEKEKEKKNIL